jgi:hypothetical protein
MGDGDDGSGQAMNAYVRTSLSARADPLMHLFQRLDSSLSRRSVSPQPRSVCVELTDRSSVYIASLEEPTHSFNTYTYRQPGSAPNEVEFTLRPTSSVTNPPSDLPGLSSHHADQTGMFYSSMYPVGNHQPLQHLSFPNTRPIDATSSYAFDYYNVASENHQWPSQPDLPTAQALQTASHDQYGSR